MIDQHKIDIRYLKFESEKNIAPWLQVFPHRWTFNKQNHQFALLHMKKTDNENDGYCKIQFSCGVMA
jgi:hypothetical protein